MKTEFEAKFTNITIAAIRVALHAAGAKREEPMRLMRRAVIDTPELTKKNAFVRIRDEGNRITVTYKQFDSLSIEGTKEIEIIVSDFNEAIALFAAAGLSYTSFQESKRETWVLDAVEIAIDEWPWLDPYIEIEGNSEAQVRKVAKKLGFNWNDALFGDVMTAYRVQYPHLSEQDTIGYIPRVAFGDALPDLLRA